MVALVLATLAILAGCSDRMVFGNIPPSTFRFVTVIDNPGRSPGGWQVAQVVVLLERLSTMFPRTATCDIEVGTPIINRQQGFIPVEMAQEESAIAADRVARELFQKREPVASLCVAFRKRMTKVLGDANRGPIAGAKVSDFKHWRRKKVPRKTFPPRRGQ